MLLLPNLKECSWVYLKICPYKGECLIKLANAVSEILFLEFPALCYESFHLVCVLVSESLAILIEVFDERVKLILEVTAVLHEKLSPHCLIHGRNSRHVLKASAAESALKFKFGTLYIGARNYMRKL